MSKILNILLVVLIVITAGLVVLFFVGGELPNQQYSTPIYTDILLQWAYALLGISAVVALIFPAVRLVTRPQQAVKSLLGLIGVGVLVAVAYSMADGTPLKLIGYTGTDNVHDTLIWADTIIFTMYFLLGATVLSIFVTELIRRVR